MRSLTTAKKQIRRTPYQAIAAILVLTVTFFIGSIFALIALGSQAVLNHFETRPQVIAYLKDDVTQDQTTSLKQTLEATGQVEDVRFISKEEALAIYKESVGNDPLLLGSLTDLSTITAEVLPSSLEISAKNAESFTEIIEILKKSELVETKANGDKDIDFPQDVVTELTAWTKGLRAFGLILIAALSLSSVLTVSIIISMKIRSRRSEIQTMKLLGARNSFISTPYTFESIFYSVVGATLGWILCYTALLYATPFLAPRLSGIIDFPVSPLLMLYLLGGSILSAIVLGMASGLLAVGRFLSSR